ncbi:MAG TPA: NF038122 family metalloprotease [Blastocatellia bacterium]|nr:NF038122 family metalloprotease [Blastocatellia bacterium]
MSIDSRSPWSGPNALGTFVRKSVGGGQTTCIEASARQASSLKDRDAGQPMSDLVPESQPSGLRMLLRGTSQLQGFPAAREAFRRAAAQWEALIQTQVTIVVDVDFGPTLFGEPFDDDVVSATDAQVLGGNSVYPAFRAAAISEAESARRVSIYSSLPSRVVPTDQGERAGIATSSATLRALGLIARTPDLEDERGAFGAPPAIGFNSKFNFDFDSSDGIDSDKLDFEAMAVHELGHVLGFVSTVGQQELDLTVDAQPSIWDLFRVCPDSGQAGLTGATRLLSSGGEQSFFTGDRALALSTGRPDGQGGDGREASHWKDDNLTGETIGVMDPTIGPGEHYSMTSDDVLVLETIGFRLRSLFLVPLISGRPQTGGMPGPPSGLGFVSHTQYSIAVPAGATGLRIDLNGNQDVDLFARFGQRVFNQGFRPESDYFSATDSGSESITITASASPPLKQGTYYIAVANFGPGDADYTVTATITGGNNTRPPAIFDIRAQLEGDSLRLDCAAVDLDADLAGAEVSLLDESDRVAGSSSIAIESGDSRHSVSGLSLAGMKLVPTALRASVVLIDRAGNRSPEGAVDFSKAERGGLTLRSASFDGSRLTLKVSGAADDLQLEINGQNVAPPLKIKAKGSAKLVINGDASQLGLKAGANRIRVRNSQGWSNIQILSS